MAMAEDSLRRLAENLLAKGDINDIRRALGVFEFSAYKDDPVGFGADVLQEHYTPDVEMLMESVRDNVITIAKSANATGKTHGAARVATWFYKTHPNTQVYTTAAPPEDNLKKLLWGEIGDLISKNPSVFQDDEITSLNIKRSPLEFITGVTIPAAGTHAERVAKFSGKHAENLLFILDEGDAIPDAVYEGIESCMSGGSIVRLLIMFNPRSEAGEVYRMEKYGKANIVELSAFNHPNVVLGENIIPGAVTRDITIKRINSWCRPKHEEEKVDDLRMFELPEFLVGATAETDTGGRSLPLESGWYVIQESIFSYMVLGKYPAQGANQLISAEWINNARSRWDAHVTKFGEGPPRNSTCIMGLDIAEGEVDGDSNVACFRWGGFVERFRLADNVWTGLDLVKTGDKATEKYHTRRCDRANVDGTGVGAGVAPHMRRLNCNAFSVKVASSPTIGTEMGEFKILRDQLLWALREWLRTDPGAMLPPDDLLEEELRCPTYEAESGKIRVMPKRDMRELLKRSPDRMDALALTFYTERSKPVFRRATSRANYAWSS